VGDREARAPALVESTVGYHSFCTEILTRSPESGIRTVSGGQFDWGGRLLKSNGGAQRFPQRGWKSREECKGKRELDCETYKSSRDESRA
jgi:hypothetical protein